MSVAYLSYGIRRCHPRLRLVVGFIRVEGVFPGELAAQHSDARVLGTGSLSATGQEVKRVKGIIYRTRHESIGIFRGLLLAHTTELQEHVCNLYGMYNGSLTSSDLQTSEDASPSTPQPCFQTNSTCSSHLLENPSFKRWVPMMSRTGTCAWGLLQTCRVTGGRG